MEHPPTTELEVKEYAVACLEAAIYQVNHGFPDIAKGQTEAALQHIQKWRRLTDDIKEGQHGE